MKKRFTLMLLVAFVAMASYAQPKLSPDLRLLPAKQVMKELAAMPSPANKAQSPLLLPQKGRAKANVTVDDLVGVYTAKATVSEQKYTFKVTLYASDVEGEVLLSGLYPLDDFKATFDAENSMLAIELGQVVYNHATYGNLILSAIVNEGVYQELHDTGTIGALVEEDGSIIFPSDIYLIMTIAEGDYAGYYLTSYVYSDITLTSGFADFAITSWDDVNLTYLSTEGDVVGNANTLVTGVAVNGPTYVELNITTTDLVNVVNPDDKLLLDVGSNLSFKYGSGEEDVDREISAVVKDWTNATPGATYQATINYQATLYKYDEETETLSEGEEVTMAPTTLTLNVPRNMDLVFTPWDNVELTYGSTEGDFVGSPNTLISGLGSRDYVTVEVTFTDLVNYYDPDDHLSLDFGGNMNITYNIGYGYEPYSEESGVRAMVDWTNATPGAYYLAEISYKVTLYEYDAVSDSYTECYIVAPSTTLGVEVPLSIAITPWEDRELTPYSTEGDLVGNKNTLLSGLPADTKDYVHVPVINTHLVNVDDPDDQLILGLSFVQSTGPEDNLRDYSPLFIDGQEIEYSETTGYGNESISTIVGEWEYIYIDNYGSAEDFEKVKDVLKGKIAVCNRGGNISFYIKANAAMANGAVGIIVVNNQAGTVNMNLTGYEYDKPAVSIMMADGEFLKEKATYVDGDAPYYRGTLTVGETATGHSVWTFGYGWAPDYGTYYDTDEDVTAFVRDWTNATPGATYQATINYNEITYYQHYSIYGGGWFSFAIDPEEIGAKPTTLTVTIPVETGIGEVNANGNGDNRMFNLMGVAVGNDYKGLVIKNGKKVLR